MAKEQTKPIKVKLISYAEHKASPLITGKSDKLTNSEVCSPKTIRAINTVKTGAELLIVSANETGTYHKAISPNRIVEYLIQYVNQLLIIQIMKINVLIVKLNLRLPTTIRLRLKSDLFNTNFFSFVGFDCFRKNDLTLCQYFN